MKLLSITALLLLGVVASAAHTRCPRYQVVVFTDTSKNARGLVKITEDYKKSLGGINNGNNPGPLPNGQRSIDWDAPIVPFDFPGNFFDKTVTRGAVFSAKGGKFAVSNPASPPPKDYRFSSILPLGQTKRFKPFSLERLFTPIKRNRVRVSFKVPAANGAAAVTGFGAVFIDVDRPRATFMKYYNKDNCLIAKVQVPPRNKGLSFAGITVLDPNNPGKLLPVVSRVVMKLGNISVERFVKGYSGYENKDLVVVDDLFYGEPQPLYRH